MGSIHDHHSRPPHTDPSGPRKKQPSWRDCVSPKVGGWNLALSFYLFGIKDLLMGRRAVASNAVSA